jgi:hypothetical protein
VIGDPLREQSARLELLDELLESLTDVLDIREVSKHVAGHSAGSPSRFFLSAVWRLRSAGEQ